LTLGEPTSSTASTQPAASVVQANPTIMALRAVHDVQLEASQASILHVTPNIGTLDSRAAQTCPSRTEHDETAEIRTFISTEDAAIIIDNETSRVSGSTSAASLLCAIERQFPERRPHHGAFRRGGLAGMGLVGLFSVLWLNPASHLEGEAPGTIDQAPVSIRVWTDPPPPEQVRSAAETSLIATQAKQLVNVAPSGLTAVQKAPSEVATHTAHPADDQLVAPNSIALVPMPREVVQSVSVASVPLPPRRPMSLLVRHVPAALPVPPAPMMSAPASTEPSAEQAESSESYTSFSARKHEIGTHKLPWGMARLHEDPNSDTSRGAVWDFVPSEP
jgi:hypothetical protein